MSSGTVHVYIIAPDGHTIDAQHVATASRVEPLIEMLERTVAKLATPEAQPLVKPTVQSAAPKAGPESLVLHLTARTLTRRGDEYVPVQPALGQPRSGSWGAYAAEDWIVLAKEDWHKFLPADEPVVGTTWEIDRSAAAKVLTHCYPSTENNDISTNRIEQQTLRATALSIQDGVIRARLDGGLRMKHPFYHKDDDNFVEATLLGYVEIDAAKKTIRTFQLVTDKASYGRTAFGVVVRSVP